MSNAKRLTITPRHQLMMSVLQRIEGSSIVVVTIQNSRYAEVRKKDSSRVAKISSREVDTLTRYGMIELAETIKTKGYTKQIYKLKQ